MPLSVHHTSLMRHKMDGGFLECWGRKEGWRPTFSTSGDTVTHPDQAFSFLSSFLCSICWAFSFFSLTLFCLFSSSKTASAWKTYIWEDSHPTGPAPPLLACLLCSPGGCAWSPSGQISETPTALMLYCTYIIQQYKRMCVCQSIPANKQLQIAFCLIHRNQV